MDTIIFGGYTLQQILIGLAILVALIVVIKLVKKLFSSNKVDRHHQVVRCKSCGWEGQVSQYAGRCPKCNQPLGAQKAAKYRKKQ